MRDTKEQAEEILDLISVYEEGGRINILTFMANVQEVINTYLNPWISVEERLPEKDGIYLTILASDARAQHAKRWAGMGKPEITVFCNDWPMKWNARGSLIVAFWQELPKFDLEWIMDVEGEQGHWQPNPPKE